LQQAALDTGCLLPVYGSSELNLVQAYTRPFQPTILFHDRPTEFTVFPVGKAETTCLIILQKLAAVGPALLGRKVAVSLSAFWFFERLTAWADEYAGNFSDLHAGELAFNTRLSLQLRQLSLETPRKNLVPDFAAPRSAVGLADVAPAGGRIVPCSFQQQRFRAG
jgi:D-alanine transfer protein